MNAYLTHSHGDDLGDELSVLALKNDKLYELAVTVIYLQFCRGADCSHSSYLSKNL